MGERVVMMCKETFVSWILNLFPEKLFFGISWQEFSFPDIYKKKVFG
jgi:hypothetical protein